MKNRAFGVKGDAMGALFESKMATLTRLINAAQSVSAGAVAVNKDTVEVCAEDVDELDEALREWGGNDG